MVVIKGECAMFNPYLNNQYNGTYIPNYNYNQQIPMQRPMQMQTTPQPQTTEDVPFNDIKFVTEDEAKGYILFPNTRVMLLDRDKSVFYIKTADSLGKSTLEGYKYTKLEDKSSDNVSREIDTKDFVKTQDLKGYITREDLTNFITKDDMKNFITKEEFDNVIKERLSNGN